MLFSIVGQDTHDSLELRKKYRPAHLARLQKLSDVGRLELAGPNPISDQEDTNPGFSGSVVIAEFDSLEEATAWADQDPYLVNGVYESVVVKPFKKVF